MTEAIKYQFANTNTFTSFHKINLSEFSNLITLRLSIYPTLAQMHTFHCDLLLPFHRTSIREVVVAVSWKLGDQNGNVTTIEDIAIITHEFNVSSIWLNLHRIMRLKVNYNVFTDVADIEAECQDDYMKIRVGFNGSFSGLLYSAGEFWDNWIRSPETVSFWNISFSSSQTSLIGYAYDPGE